MTKAKKGLAEAGVKKRAPAEGELEVRSMDFAEDITPKKDLHLGCMTKASDFEAETKRRGDELATLAKAKQDIKDSTGSAEEQTYGRAQVSFLQVASSQQAVVRLARDLARK